MSKKAGKGKKGKNKKASNEAVDRKALIGAIAIAVVFILLVAGVVWWQNRLDPPTKVDPPPPPPPKINLEEGLDIETQTAGWCVKITMDHARLVWREDAYLVKIEWRNLFDDGIIGEGDAVSFIFASDYSDKYYRIVADKWGKTAYDEGELEKSDAFEIVKDFKIKNWKFDSDKAITEAARYFIEDDEKITSFFVVPASATDGEYQNDMNMTILIIQSQHQFLQLDGRTGDYLTTETHGLAGIDW